MDEGSAETLAVGVVRVDRSGTIAAANRWFAEWAGAAADDMVGRSIGEFLIHSHEDLLPPDTTLGPWMMLHARERDRAVMMTRQRRGAGEVLMLAEASERFRALIDLRRRYALADRTRTRLELVMDSSVAFSTASTERSLAEILADTTARAYRAEESTVLLRQPDGTSRIAAGPDVLEGRIDVDALIGMVAAPRRVVKVVGDAEGERLVPGLGAAMRLVRSGLRRSTLDSSAR